ncbi:AAA+ ATPase domain-containing protein [Tanacetum coccineum]
MPTASSLLSAYASLSTSIMLFRTMFNQLFPRELQRYVADAVRFYWKPKSSKLTLVFDEKDGMVANHIYDAAEAFLCTRINPDSERLRITKSVKESHINIKFAESEEIVDSFEGIPVTWKYVRHEAKQKSSGGGGDDYGGGKSSSSGGYSPERKYIELRFDKVHKERIISSYLPTILRKAKELENDKKVVKLHNLQSYSNGPGGFKESVNLDHPSTFDTLAMDPMMKKAIMDDLDLFLKRRDFYKRVGKAWKRGYLLYGPPGTGKSSLIAAIANYLKFDIFDLQLMNIGGDSSLKKLMLRTSNRSILVIEDIDCSIQLPGRKGITTSTLPDAHYKPVRDPQMRSGTRFSCRFEDYVEGVVLVSRLIGFRNIVSNHTLNDKSGTRCSNQGYISCVWKIFSQDFPLVGGGFHGSAYVLKNGFLGSLISSISDQDNRTGVGTGNKAKGRPRKWSWNCQTYGSRSSRVIILNMVILFLPSNLELLWLPSDIVTMENVTRATNLELLYLATFRQFYQFSLSGLLNFIDGLWSCCGDERIIIFTTNHKERLDPALLRPGRMDVHIHMSYLTTDGFNTLAANYLNIDHHWRFREIKQLIECKKVTPAEVAEELMKSDNAEVVLEGLVNFLKRKRIDEDENHASNEGIDVENGDIHEAKKAKVIS